MRDAQVEHVLILTAPQAIGGLDADNSSGNGPVKARAARGTDTDCTNLQRLVIGVVYFGLVLGLSWFGSTVFDELPQLVREAMGD